jgi:hypothetical protein
VCAGQEVYARPQRTHLTRLAAKGVVVAAICGKSMEVRLTDVREVPGKDFVTGITCHGPLA